jgi:putative FmdB family regulatory protein
MPFYEYLAKDLDNACDLCKQVFEERQSITSDPLTSCPQCGSAVERQVSLVGGIIMGSRQMNQYNDVKYAKYWRDQNGVRHKVTPGDGHSNAPTVPKRQTASPAEVQARIKRDKKADQRKRSNESYRRYVQRVKRAKK